MAIFAAIGVVGSFANGATPTASVGAMVGEIAVERLYHEVALLEMRSEQLRIHLESVPDRSAEAHKVRAVLSAMRLKIRALRQFERAAGKGRGTALLH